MALEERMWNVGRGVGARRDSRTSGRISGARRDSRTSGSRCTSERLIWASLVVFGLAGLFPAHAWAQNKSGVSPTSISRPSGPGSLEGLGDAFQPAYNTGMARYPYAFSLPDGISGFTPEFELQYDSGLGFGPAGIGWTFDPGSIRRQTDKGIPQYGHGAAGVPSDRFLGMDGEELVPLVNGYYLAKVEGSFIRCRRVGNSWEAHAKSGTKFEFGLTDAGRVSDPTGNKIFRWNLERQTDTNGNVIEYSYTRPVAADRQVYLGEIRYGPGSSPWTHSYSVQLFYDGRPDTRTDYRSGFLVRTTKRLARVDVMYDDDLIRRYEIGYAAHPHWSLPTTITLIGADGVSTLPTTTFGYAVFDAGDPAVAISAAGAVIGSVNEPGSVFDNGKVDLIDLNADGLPDLLTTDLGHAVYLNRGVSGGVEQGFAAQRAGGPAVSWEGPIAVVADEARALNIDLAQSNVHLADMTGDGVADLVVTEPGTVEFFENTGVDGWGAGQLMSVTQSAPPAPFGVNGESVQTADIDFDKRIDVIKSDFGAYSVWFNLGDGVYSDEVVVDGAFHNGQFVDFADPGVALADVNGDRLCDIVKITAISVVYFPSMGRGRFDAAVEMFLPDRALDDSPTGNLSRAKMTDVNGDGLSDLVVERAQGDDLWFWLNLGNNTFAPSRVVTDLPSVSGSAEVRWADINGNGTTDLIYGDSSLFDSKIQSVDLAVLIAGSPFLNALTSIDNGYGRRISIEYRSSTEYLLDARRDLNPWSITVPFPMQVVSRTATSISLDLDGYADEGADGDVYLTDFVYRDGYYDPFEKQFRGFAFVKKIERGDERFGGSSAPTLVTRMAYHTGAPDGVDNDGDGQTDEFHRWDGREEEPIKGVELWHERCSLPDDPLRDGSFADDAVVFDRVVNTWVVRNLCTPLGGPLPDAFTPDYATADEYERVVRQAVRTRVATMLLERQTDPAVHKRLENRSDVDVVGNTSFDWNLGDLDNPSDDLYTGYEYARGGGAWIVDRVTRVSQREGSPDGAFVSEIRNFYDGDPFVGLPLGQVGARGNLHRTQKLISPADDPPVVVPELTERSYLRGDPRDPSGRIDSLRQRFDGFGNPVVTLDANAVLNGSGQPDDNGHERRVDYDPFLHKFPIRETIVVGGMSPTEPGQPDLVIDAAYHLGFGTPLSVSDFNGHVTRYSYDVFGRLSEETSPGDDAAAPTRRYSYDWTAPFSTTTTVTHTKEGESPDVTTKQYFDGLGRALGALEAGGPVATNVTMYNTRGNVSRVYQPYFGQPVAADGSWLLPLSTADATDTAYGALGRSVETLSPPDANGVRSRGSTAYLPLVTVESDGEDNRVGGPHFGTPKTLVHDGLERLIEVREVETLSAADSGVFVTKYRYVLPDLPAEVEDSNGNIKYMRYDGLGREIFMNDCNRGAMTNTYDPVGNMLNTVDAKGQRIDFTYDGANRLLTEDYGDEGTPLSSDRSPDVRYHYDTPSSDYPWLRNTRGQLAWVEDQTGAEYHGFDARANADTTIKRIAQANASVRDFTTVTLSDSLGRVYQTVYPDGSVVRNSYDDRGLLVTIPGFVDSISYRASRQKDVCTYNNGVTTTYSYDPRLRVTRLLTQSSTAVLQDLNYTHDQVDNILAIDDGRSLPPGDPPAALQPRSQTATFVMDNLYRLQRAVGAGYGTIDYDYDRLGNMVAKTSPNIADPLVDMGTMVSGGAMGTVARIGRSVTDSPGPHAITAITGGATAHAFGYDANGNMTAFDSDGYEFDFKDRLGRVTKDGRDVRYLYDFTDRRVIKRVDGEQTTYISKMSEIRGGELIQYVFAGAARVARFEGALTPPERITQRIPLVRGWNLISFQVDPGVSDPALVMADIADVVRVVYGYDQGVFLPWSPVTGGSLPAMLPDVGYWIWADELAELIVEGPLSNTAVEIAGGSWSLTGMPGLAPRDQEDTRVQVPTAGAVWIYTGDEFGWRVMTLSEPLWLGNLTATSTGLGYWVAPSDLSSLDAMSPPALPPLFYHADQVRSTNLTSDAAGLPSTETLYYPFGTSRHEWQATKGVGSLPHYRYGDKERDAETGLHYFEARYCDSQVARFISVDSVISASPMRYVESPRMSNLYAYAANNPLRYTDPTGNDPKDDAKGAAKTTGSILDIIGGATDTALQYLKQKTPRKVPTLVTVKPGGFAGAVAKYIKPLAPGLKALGTVAGVVGVGLGTAEATQGVMDGEADKVLGGTADAGVGIYGLLGGNFGAAFAGGYAVGGVAAEQLDKNTSLYDNSTKAANRAERAVEKATGSKTAGVVVGVGTSVMETFLPGSTNISSGLLEWYNSD